MDPLLVVIVLALACAAAAMLLGILVMSGGGATDAWLSTPLMWVRIAFQGLTVLLLVLAAVIR
jgi:hypothetical protein